MLAVEEVEKVEEQKEKVGFFKRLVQGLGKTRDNIVSGMDSIFSGFSHIDDDFYEELEEVLIMGDLGVQATYDILDDLKAKVKAQHIKEPVKCRELLIESIKEQMDVGETAYDFEEKTSVVMVIGGSLGAANVNKAVRAALPSLLGDFQVVHLCGKDKVDNLLLNTPGYRQFEYVKAELKDLFAMADVVISRAGANAICELLALKKPNILIPLPASSSRGDQLLNARSFEAQGFSIVIGEDDLTTELLVDKVHELYFSRQTFRDAMNDSGQMDSIRTILRLIEECICEKG